MSKTTTGRQLLDDLEKRVAELERQLAVLMRSIQTAPQDATVKDLGREMGKRLDG